MRWGLELTAVTSRQLEGKATLQFIENAGHLVQSERPSAYNKHLKKILASLHEDGKKK
jgi:pimeloyl-ACP methyl ester carboxylesterase